MKISVDVHDHVFSGRDIPLDGYLLSRHYDEWDIRLLAPILFPLLADDIRREGSVILKPLEKLVLDIAYGYMGQGYRRWVDIVSLRKTADIARRMVETYLPDAVDLFIPLMIDFEYWFRRSPDNSIASQIESVYQDVVLPYKGRIHPFAPFDPARELAFRAGLPGPNSHWHGAPESFSSMELMKDAIRTKGFIGVKVYNTLGYRPLGNAEVDAERRSIFLNNGMKRYAAFSGEEFDQILLELYEFCVQEQVPITAHCVSNGIEAYPGASLVFGGPRFWRPVLDRFPDLRLNLAHFGWSRPDAYRFRRRRRPLHQMLRGLRSTAGAISDAPEPDEGRKTWTSEICEMLAAYPHLYTDVAHHGIIVESDVPKFVVSYRKICGDYPGLVQQRLLYGTDWHVFTRMDNFQNFKGRYRRLLEERLSFTEAEIEDFLGRNALRFLGVLPPRTPGERGWTENRKRLKEFYQREGIHPPPWFVSAAEESHKE